MGSDNHSVPPGPRGYSALRLKYGFRRDILGWLSRLGSEYGDIVCMGNKPHLRILLNRPDLVERVLVVDHSKFNKGAPQQRVGQMLFGDGLLTSEGELWRRQRRLEQPAFQRSHVVEYGTSIVDITSRYIRGWQEGDVRDVVDEMMSLTLLIALKTLFGIESISEVKKIGDAIYAIVRYDLRRMRSLVPAPANWPSAERRRAETASKFLEETVYSIIAEKQRRAAEGVDLLSTLIHAMDDDGTGMTAKQLRDETMTLLIAGHETTALAIAWTLHLISHHPNVEAKLFAELHESLGFRRAEAGDLEKLSYLRAVIDESLRLYPPVYVISRVATERIELGGYYFPAGTTFLMAPWIIHRSAKYFEDPLEFRPERWLQHTRTRLPNFTYFPFGGGPRRCIGATFASTEAALVLATLLQQFRFLPAPGHSVILGPTVTLRPKYGMKMVLKGRTVISSATLASSGAEFRD